MRAATSYYCGTVLVTCYVHVGDHGGLDIGCTLHPLPQSPGLPRAIVVDAAVAILMLIYMRFELFRPNPHRC